MAHDQLWQLLRGMEMQGGREVSEEDMFDTPGTIFNRDTTTAGERALAESRRERDEMRAYAERTKASEQRFREEVVAGFRKHGFAAGPEAIDNVVRERDEARADIKQLTEEKRAMAKMIAAECADPNGTIWDRADRLSSDLDRIAHAIGVCYCHDQGCGGAGPVDEQIKAVERMHMKCAESADLRLIVERLRGALSAIQEWDFDIMGDCVLEARRLAYNALDAKRGEGE
jgi:hypothetical protein